MIGTNTRVETQIGQLRHFLPLVEKVITQTKKRVWGGNCHGEDKVLSLFEVHHRSHTQRQSAQAQRVW